MPRLNKKKRPTIDDVARLSGLSIATVSRYMNGTVYVSEENAAKIQNAIEVLNYVPHTAAQVLAGRQNFTLGLLLPKISGDFFAPILRGVETCAMQEGYSLLVHSTELSSQKKGLFKRVLGEHNSDGLIVFTVGLNESELRAFNQSGFPVVLLYQSPPDDLKIPHVIIENHDAVEQLVHHLVQVHGRRHILHLRGLAGNDDAQWREEGYRRALQSEGLPFDPSLIINGNYEVDASRLAVLDAVQRGLQFDAILAADDDSAIGSVLALRELGISVPEQVSVTGFDDIRMASYFAPPLTTVRSPIEQAGYEATRMLLQLIRGEAVNLELRLSTELVIRHSCGCP